MRYVAKQPRDGINVSNTHPLIEASLLIGGLGIIFAGIILALIFLVEISLYFISPQKEAALFTRWVPDDFISVSSDDKRLQETQALIKRLVRHWPDAHYTFRVAIDDSDIANAMALPGGLIVVSKGLLDQIESENELAFVLGHELGHFNNRDHLRALGRGIFVSMYFATITGNDVAGLNMTIADIALKGFSRKQESQADEFGLGIVNAEYGHVSEATRLFERWDRDEPSSKFVRYLSTHPDSGDRVRVMETFANENAWSTDGRITPLIWPDTEIANP